jgi:hypothetical protein
MPAPQSALGRIAGGKPVTLVVDAIWSRAGAASGATWAETLDSWARRGGRLELRRLHLAAGEAAFDARGAGLSASADGRLEGALDASLRQGDRMLTSLAQAAVVEPAAARLASEVLQANHGGALDHVTINFEAGRTTLGPVALGPSPKVY